MIDIPNDPEAPWDHGLSPRQHVQTQNSRVLHTFPTGAVTQPDPELFNETVWKTYQQIMKWKNARVCLNEWKHV